MSSLVQASDRRNSARSRIFTLVQDRQNPDPLWAWDIGLGGMQCRAKTPRFPGTYLDLRFTLPGVNEDLEVGSQVLTLDQLEDKSMSLGLRFCMLSSKAQRAIYRFLDGRRALWQSPQQIAARDSARARLIQYTQNLGDRPFQKLLLEAYAALRLKEMQRLGFIRSISPDNLPRLSQLIAQRASFDGVAHDRFRAGSGRAA